MYKSLLAKPLESHASHAIQFFVTRLREDFRYFPSVYFFLLIPWTCFSRYARAYCSAMIVDVSRPCLLIRHDTSKQHQQPQLKHVLVVTNFKTSSKYADSSIRTSFDSGEKVNYPHTREQEALDLIF